MFAAYLRSFLRVIVSLGAVFGLSMCFYASVGGDWKVALINMLVYIFSLIMLA